jgi:hypothetical protein
LSPRATQSLVDAHDRLLTTDHPAGSPPSDQEDPPSVVYAIAARSRAASPPATQSLVDGHERLPTARNPAGSLLGDQEDPLSAV